MSRDEIREALYDLVEAGYIAGRRGLGRLCAERIATELADAVAEQIMPGGRREEGGDAHERER
jgi:DNA-binding GntR family transcriptional regulator